MTQTNPKPFGRPAAQLGEPTSDSLHQLLATGQWDDDTERCRDLTKSPRGWLRCQLPAGHEADPRSFHHVDPSGPVEDRELPWETNGVDYTGGEG